MNPPITYIVTTNMVFAIDEDARDKAAIFEITEGSRYFYILNGEGVTMMKVNKEHVVYVGFTNSYNLPNMPWSGDNIRE